MNEDRKGLRRRRIAAGLSQTDLAEKAGVSKSQLSDVENGRAGFSPKNLKAIADVLDCEVPDLLLPESEDQAAPEPTQSVA
ncbi:helix-turn-helix domain-containing protein [Streptomyces sp. NPDC002920]